LDEYFSQYGKIKDSVIMVDKGTGQPRGFAFVEVSGRKELVGMDGWMNLISTYYIL
jgi:RNA recognition motif-containing protein